MLRSGDRSRRLSQCGVSGRHRGSAGGGGDCGEGGPGRDSIGSRTGALAAPALPGRQARAGAARRCRQRLRSGPAARAVLHADWDAGGTGVARGCRGPGGQPLPRPRTDRTIPPVSGEHRGRATGVRALRHAADDRAAGAGTRLARKTTKAPGDCRADRRAGAAGRRTRRRPDQVRPSRRRGGFSSPGGGRRRPPRSGARRRPDERSGRLRAHARDSAAGRQRHRIWPEYHPAPASPAR